MKLSELKTFAQNARNTLYAQVRSNLEQAIKENGSLQRNCPEVFEKLRADVETFGEDKIISKVAYYWFNRFCALRFMDVKGYTSSKIVSSETEGSNIPQILSEVKSGYFDENIISQNEKEKITSLLNGTEKSINPEADVYHILLMAACHYWHQKMPFLFEAYDDYSEYLLPLDLLSSESILQDIRDAMTKETCESVEIIGWLYQYYISEKKDQIIKIDLKNNIKIDPEDIPAATQLFTPEWIVRYVVDNSLGRLWMLNHPESSLKDYMEYYIAPSQPETDFLKIEKPQDLKICDPCCGSGHMLVYAFELLSKIYEEQGYSNSEIAKLIIENNIFGLELDERAGELASFALMMKAREKDRRIFNREVRPNICVLNKIEFSDDELNNYISTVGSELFTSEIIETMKQFSEADNFGSLIVPKCQHISDLIDKLNSLQIEDIFLQKTHQKVICVLTTADYLSQKYHIVITNPPYMGVKGMNGRLASWIKDNYTDVKTDLFSAFIIRCIKLSLPKATLGFMTPFVWMFIASFEKLRKTLLTKETITSLVQLEYSGFDGATVPICTFTLQNNHINNYKGAYIKLSNFKGPENQAPKTLEAIRNHNCGWFYRSSADNFKKIPGSTIAYWLSDKFIKVFEECPRLDSNSTPAQGLATADNDRFLRQWFEVNFANIGLLKSTSQEALISKCKWFPYNKGGEYRRWYGNQDYVINWINDGEEIKNFRFPNGKQRSVIRNPDFYFKPSVTWTDISSSFFGARITPKGFLFDVSGSSIFPSEENILYILGMMVSTISSKALKALNSTMHFQVGNIASLPVPSSSQKEKAIISSNASILIDKHKYDWDSFETSWNFRINPVIRYFKDNNSLSLEEVISKLQEQYRNNAESVKLLEELNNKYFISLYGLEDEVSPDYPISEVTLFTNTAFMYKDKSKEEQINLQKTDMIRDLISYAVGCIFGRYSLDKEGLILFNQGENIDDFKSKVPNASFEADEDNVIPVLEDSWFNDDIVECFKKFIKTAFGEDHYLENLRFIEQTLNVKGKASYSIRDYFVNEFYSDHVKRYKKRPIYWLFKSPKGHFKALIYMHRYQPYTVSRVRNEYLLEFRQRLDAEKQNLEIMIQKGGLPKADLNSKNKRVETIKKIIADLNDYDSEIMYPLAQQNIKIDLDDGVKTNYVKFGKALEKISGLD